MHDIQQQDRAPVATDRPVGGAAELRRSGFARYRAQDLGLGPADGASAGSLADELAAITSAFAELPPDPYAPTTNRFRRYSHAAYLPWSGELSWIPGLPHPEYGSVTEYYQDGHNPEYPEMQRLLPDVPAALRESRLLEHLIRFDIEQALWLDELRRAPVYAGVHMIKLSVRDADQIAVSSPDCLHQDGGSSATFTFAHLIRCDNIVGGENVIATPESAGRQPGELPAEAVHARFTLADPLDTYAVHDPRVSHYVAPVRLGAGPGQGERCILIVGLAPFAPRL
ncbi:2OG-Fe dioxygenase family protein [Streptomyces sp. SP18CS02]|uniref:2OG-Fe dioxygenase family protein n=1 Tax=Streptomyces sp. SP18CS02 TaxID=3002531 RepID=UPI002E765AF8|nr:2OG-Fe dioxygenase family protein [Streptomyces sp. SP18CS02]MEE1757442.1 2OG-Fe dioxygenase family protein [Streptomyces sp. SP18CS02]